VSHAIGGYSQSFAACIPLAIDPFFGRNSFQLLHILGSFAKLKVVIVFNNMIY
jgi:hypothetical protein